jgi:hypothetical protein
LNFLIFLSFLSSKYLVSMKAVCLDPLAVILEFCAYGDLYEFLHKVCGGRREREIREKEKEKRARREGEGRGSGRGVQRPNLKISERRNPTHVGGKTKNGFGRCLGDAIFALPRASRDPHGFKISELFDEFSEFRRSRSCLC